MDRDYFISHWQDVRSKLIELISKFRDEELDFRPYAGAWSTIGPNCR